MESSEIKKKLKNAIKQLLENDHYLIENNVSERAITHKLAEYLQNEFSERDEFSKYKYNVDCEYNKNLHDEKKVKTLQRNINEKLLEKYEKRLKKNVLGGIDLDEPFSLSTYPDIIVHKRGYNSPYNLLIVEVKKKHGEAEDLDELKLKGFTENEINPYQYQLGVLIIIKTNNSRSDNFDVKFPSLKWFENGIECVEQ